MKRVALAVLGLLFAAGSTAVAGSDGDQVRLSGYNEDPQALSTTGTGQFRARIDDTEQEISYRLTYSELEGPVTQAHLHLGGRSQSGGVIVFLCTNLGNGPAGTQACPAAPATVTGTLKAADVIGPTGQGISAGEFAELTRALRAGYVYVNVHSAKYPAGEIRAQLDHH
ncbi:CHRD domain-containing protein [Lentzea sp. NBRC 105346]|uniref:CHRD domain-containing protein n=1 Tax=Lentzea sp. NBRC 105346 TaxID=3032205 RepID=UPI0024A2B92A|nr:CHRD domain-containing protein [Lentzea sp. NBRC 105346]GLZ33821.1 CHRD domain-containing protein [Lentzea sp. NBRC 105346]